MEMQRFETYGRMIGLGKSPDQLGLGQSDANSLIASIMQTGFTQVPVIEYVTWTFNVPLADSAITSTFGAKIELLKNEDAVTGIDVVDSSFVKNGILQVDMLVMGFGIHAFGEPLAFTAIGNSMAAPSVAAAPIVSPDTFSNADLTNNALGANGAAGVIVTPAELEWGVADWQALWNLINGYEFQWIMYQRYLMIKEMAADVCYFGPYAEAEASGTSEVPLQPYVKLINAKYRAMGSTQIFVPVNARRYGATYTTSPTASTNVGVFHPTRDFDLVPVTWGGIRWQGGAGCCQPFRKLPKPVLIERGTPIGMMLIGTNGFHQTQMQRNLSISENVGGLVATVQIDTLANGLTPTGTNTFNELTLDATPVNQAQRVMTDRILYKGGTAKLSILLKGLELWGPWKQYFAGASGVTPFLSGGPPSMMSTMQLQPVASR